MTSTATTSVTSAGAAAGYMSMVSQAIKACGSIIRVDEMTFQTLVENQPNGLYVWSKAGFFGSHYKVMRSYRGMTFYCKYTTLPVFPAEAEVIQAKRLVIPDL